MYSFAHKIPSRASCGYIGEWASYISYFRGMLVAASLESGRIVASLLASLECANGSTPQATKPLFSALATASVLLRTLSFLYTRFTWLRTVSKLIPKWSATIL